jgi:uncharacterized membrane protein
MFFTDSEAAMLGSTIGYTAIIMAVVVIGVINQRQVERRYERDTELELQDDDDNWILGIFYYNKNDTRLNVEKRLGYGATINMAHPAGIVITVLSILLILGSLVYIVYLAMTGQFAV